MLVAAAVIIPLVVLAGLFIWLKLTEEADEEALELEQEQAEAGMTRRGVRARRVQSLTPRGCPATG